MGKIYGGIHLPSTPSEADMPGEITKKIGSGKHAQASIVWQTILWSFCTGIGLTILAMVLACINPEINLQVRDLLSIWSLFIPIITLALGYIFGKNTN